MRGKAGNDDGKEVSEGDVDESEEEKGWMRDMGISEGKRSERGVKEVRWNGGEKGGKGG